MVPLSSFPALCGPPSGTVGDSSFPAVPTLGLGVGAGHRVTLVSDGEVSLFDTFLISGSAFGTGPRVNRVSSDDAPLVAPFSLVVVTGRLK